MENEKMDNVETGFRELYYSSLLQQRQENETNRIKIALISVGATIAGIVGTIKGIQSLSIPYLPLVILITGYAPWICLLCVLFIKLKVDVNVIDDKIKRIGTNIETQVPPSKELADKLNKGFQWALIACLIGIIFIPTYILITGDDEMSKKKTAQETVSRTNNGRKSNTVVDKKPRTEKSYGGDLPGFFEKPTQDPPKQDPPKQDPPKQDPPKQDPPKQDQDQDKK